MIFKKSIYPIILAFLSPLFFYAQGSSVLDTTYHDSRAFLNIVFDLETGLPIGDFHDEINRDVIVGKGISVFYRLKTIPVDIGLRIGDFSYDHVKRKFDGNVQKTKSKIWNWYGAVRYEPKVKTPFQPYIEGSFGTYRFYTKTYTKEVNAFLRSILYKDEENARFDKAGLNSDWGLTYGAAIGSYFFLDKNYYSAFYIEVGYRSGNPGIFLIKNESLSVQQEPIDNYIEKRAAMSVISFKIGFSFFGFSG